MSGKLIFSPIDIFCKMPAQPTYRKKCIVDGCRKFASNPVGIANPVLRCRVHDAGLEPAQRQIPRKIRKRCVTQGCRGFAVNDEGVQNPKLHCSRCESQPQQAPQPPPVQEVSRFEMPAECPICYNNNQLQALRPCGHWCCATCISRLEQPTCPFCRTNLDMPLPNARPRRREIMHRPSQAGQQEQRQERRRRRQVNGMERNDVLNRLLEFVTAVNGMRPIMSAEDYNTQRQIANRYAQLFIEGFRM